MGALGVHGKGSNQLARLARHREHALEGLGEPRVVHADTE